MLRMVDVWFFLVDVDVGFCWNGIYIRKIIKNVFMNKKISTKFNNKSYIILNLVNIIFIVKKIIFIVEFKLLS